MVRPEDILNVSIQSQEAILSQSLGDDPTSQDQLYNQPESTLEMDKDALIDRIQQQQLREQNASGGSMIEPGSIDPNPGQLLSPDYSDENDDEVDDEAKDEDSKRHDHKANEDENVPSADSLNDLDQIEEVDEQNEIEDQDEITDEENENDQEFEPPVMFNNVTKDENQHSR